MLITCVVIFIAVFSVMFYSIWKHRKSVGHKPANFHESVTVEVIWTVIPFLIVIGMALPATKVLVASKDTSNADVTIEATGSSDKLSAMLKMLEPYGIKELVQSGTIAIGRGARSITDRSLRALDRSA